MSIVGCAGRLHAIKSQTNQPPGDCLYTPRVPPSIPPILKGLFGAVLR
jgi:hypothetical protein